MKRQLWGLFAVALTVPILGLVAFGVPMSTLVFVTAALTSPLIIHRRRRRRPSRSTAGERRDRVAHTGQAGARVHMSVDELRDRIALMGGGHRAGELIASRPGGTGTAKVGRRTP